MNPETGAFGEGLRHPDNAGTGKEPSALRPQFASGGLQNCVSSNPLHRSALRFGPNGPKCQQSFDVHENEMTHRVCAWPIDWLLYAPT